MKNLAEYNNPEEIGSYHWYITLLASIKHIGEYLKEKDPPNPEILKKWGEMLHNNACDLIEYRQELSNGKMDKVKEIRELFDKIEKTL